MLNFAAVPFLYHLVLLWLVGVCLGAQLLRRRLELLERTTVSRSRLASSQLTEARAAAPPDPVFESSHHGAEYPSCKASRSMSARPTVLAPFAGRPAVTTVASSSSSSSYAGGGSQTARRSSGNGVNNTSSNSAAAGGSQTARFSLPAGGGTSSSWDDGTLHASSLFDHTARTMSSTDDFASYAASPRDAMAQSTQHGPYTLRLPNQPYADTSMTTGHHTASGASNNFASSQNTASHARFYYKLVATAGPNKYLSIYDGKTEYVLGQTLRRPIKVKAHGGATRRQQDYSQAGQEPSQAWSSRKVKDETQGGIFVCRTAEEALETRIPDEAALYCAPRVLMKMLCYGSSIQYSGSTIAFECCRPVQVFPLSLDYLSTAFGDKTQVKVKLAETRNRLPPFHGPQRKILQTYRERDEINAVTKEIMAHERTLTQITRAQLGGGSAATTARTPRTAR